VGDQTPRAEARRAKGDSAREPQTTSPASSARPRWERVEAFVREQVQRLLQALWAAELTVLLGRPKAARRRGVAAPKGRRHGEGTSRRLRWSLGTITVRRPGVRGLGARFVRRVLPRFQRRPREVGARLPPLYLHGLALGDFELARRGRVGAGAPRSAPSLARLKARWPREDEAWKPPRREDLEGVYVWAEGLSSKAGLADSKAARLVRSGACTDGQHIGLAVERGPRASTAAGAAGLRALRARGLKPWRCTSADGHLGLGAAVAAQQPTAAEPRGWNHRLTTVVAASPQKQPAQARTLRCALPDAESQAACEALRGPVAKRDGPLAPKAVERLAHDWERLVTFDQVPRDHWRPLRTTKVVESPVAAARLRTSAAKRVKKVDSATALIWKLLPIAARTFRRRKAPELWPAVDAGAQDVDGIKTITGNHQ
jgi:putative transposase